MLVVEGLAFEEFGADLGEGGDVGGFLAFLAPALNLADGLLGLGQPLVLDGEALAVRPPRPSSCRALAVQWWSSYPPEGAVEAIDHRGGDWPASGLLGQGGVVVLAGKFVMVTSCGLQLQAVARCGWSMLMGSSVNPNRGRRCMGFLRVNFGSKVIIFPNTCADDHLAL